jgi:hypothetical protein
MEGIAKAIPQLQWAVRGQLLSGRGPPRHARWLVITNLNNERAGHHPRDPDVDASAYAVPMIGTGRSDARDGELEWERHEHRVYNFSELS